MPIDQLEREELSNKTEIEKLLEEIKNSAIGFENYKQFFDKIKNSDQIIMSQIENLVREYREYKVKFTTEFEKDSHKSLVDDGFVRLDVFENARMMNKIILEAYNWKTLQEELYNIIFKKIYTVLDDARALDIKRDALKEMKEMEEKRQAMFIEIMNNSTNMFRDAVVTKLQAFDEKFLNLVMMIDEDNRRDRKDIFDTLKTLIHEFSALDESKRKEITRNVQQDNVESKRERLYREPQRIEQPRQPRPQMQPRQQQPIQIKETVKMDDIDAQFDDLDDDDMNDMDIEDNRQQIKDNNQYEKFD